MTMAGERSAGAAERMCSARGRLFNCLLAASKTPVSMRVIELEFGDQFGEWPCRFRVEAASGRRCPPTPPDSGQGARKSALTIRWSS